MWNCTNIITMGYSGCVICLCGISFLCSSMSPGTIHCINHDHVFLAVVLHCITHHIHAHESLPVLFYHFTATIHCIMHQTAWDQLFQYFTIMYHHYSWYDIQAPKTLHNGFSALPLDNTLPNATNYRHMGYTGCNILTTMIMAIVSHHFELASVFNHCASNKIYCRSIWPSF